VANSVIQGYGRVRKFGVSWNWAIELKRNQEEAPQKLNAADSSKDREVRKFL